MKKTIVFLVALTAFCLSVSACSKESQTLLGVDEAKNALLSSQASADILSFRLSDTQSDYIAVFSKSDRLFLALVDAENGRVHDVQPLPLPSSAAPAPEEDEKNSGTENTSSDRLSEQDVLAIARAAADTSGDLALMKSEYDSASDSYLILLKSGNIEYRYVIDAANGDILSSAVDTDM